MTSTVFQTHKEPKDTDHPTVIFTGNFSVYFYPRFTESFITSKSPQKPDFVSMLKKTELLGAVSVLYGSIVLERNSQSGTEGIILNAESERTSMLVLQGEFSIQSPLQLRYHFSTFF